MLGPFSFDPGHHVDQDDPLHQFRSFLGQGDGREPTERHPYDAGSPGGELSDGGGDVDGITPGVQRAPGAGPRPVRVAVAGEIDGHQGPAQGQCHRVPGVGVLGPPVQEYQLWFAPLPLQSTQPAPGGHLDREAADLGGTVEGEPVLLGVLVEQPELVIVEPVNRHGSLPRPTARRSRFIER